MGVNVHGVEDFGQLVHEGNVHIALRVLDDFGGLGHLNARCFVGTVDENAVVDRIHIVGNLGC